MNINFNPSHQFNSAKEARAYAQAQQVVSQTDALMEQLKSFDDGLADYHKGAGDEQIIGMQRLNDYTFLNGPARYQFNAQSGEPQRLHAHTYDGEVSTQWNFERGDQVSVYTQNGADDSKAVRIGVDNQTHAIVSYSQPDPGWTFGTPVWPQW